MGSVNEEAHREDVLIIPVATTEVGHFGYRILNQVGELVMSLVGSIT